MFFNGNINFAIDVFYHNYLSVNFKKHFVDDDFNSVYQEEEEVDAGDEEPEEEPEEESIFDQMSPQKKREILY